MARQLAAPQIHHRDRLDVIDRLPAPEHKMALMMTDAELAKCVKITDYQFVCVASPVARVDPETLELVCRQSEKPTLRKLAARLQPIPPLLPLLVAWEHGDRRWSVTWEQPVFSTMVDNFILISSEAKWMPWIGAPYKEDVYRRFVPQPQHSLCVCGKPGEKLCSRCKAQRYCGPKCQKADWPRHRPECGSGVPARSSDLDVAREQGRAKFAHPCKLLEKAMCAERAVAERIFARLEAQREAKIDWVSIAAERALKAMATGELSAPPGLVSFFLSPGPKELTEPGKEEIVAFRALLPKREEPDRKTELYLMVVRLRRPVNDDSPCPSGESLVTSIYGFLAFPGCEGKVVRVSRRLIVVEGQRLNNFVEVTACPVSGGTVDIPL